jgi:drug/metabolite transporter (DMT)-like permease
MKFKANIAADGAILLTTIIWGSTFVVARGVLEAWPPISYLAVRLSLATLVLTALFWRRLAASRRAEARAGATLGLLVGIGFLGQTIGLLYTSPAKSAFITSLTTPLVPFVAYALFRSRPGRENLLGVVLASIGGLLILAPVGAAGFNTGDLLTLGTIVLFALHISLMSVYARLHDARRLTVWQIATAACVLIAAWCAVWVSGLLTGVENLPRALGRELAPPAMSAWVVGQLIYLSIVATVFTFLLWAWGQARMSATHAAIIFSLEPVFATLFAVAARGRGEWPGGRANLGALLIVAGVVVSELRWGRREESREQ